jgi:MobA/MobL family
MAVYFLRSRHVSRGRGARATRAAAYRAGERIRDERSGEVYDYSSRHDVAYKEIIIPAEMAVQPEMAWALDRSTLWNAAEEAGKQRNSRLAREWLVLLPPELSPEQRSRLARRFAVELAEHYRCAVDLAIHRPKTGADPRHNHAHLLMTTRELTPQGLGKRLSLELSGRPRYQAGLQGDARTEFVAIRARWASLTNEALREAGVAERVDHRSYAAQGIDRDPATTLPEKVYYAERKRGPSATGEAIRARALERSEARRRGPEELRRVEAEQEAASKRRIREYYVQRADLPQRPRWGQLNLEERRARRREQYLAWRAAENKDPARLEARRERSRRYYAAHRESVSAQQREYRRARREQQLAKARHTESQVASSTAEQSLENWRAYREQHGTGPTPEQSLRAWHEYREQHGAGPTPEDSLRAWHEYRARQHAEPTASLTPQPPPQHEHSPGRDDDPQQHPQPDFDRDF